MPQQLLLLVSMKQKLVDITRKVLPKSSQRAVEDAYRKTRAVAIGARYGYPAKGLRIIAITGTNGKTTTACYLNEILKAAGHKTALFSTAIIEVAGDVQINDLNATVADVARMQQFFAGAKRAQADFVIIEVTSHSLDQHKLAGVPIECAIMTNLTQDHLDYHPTMEAYAEAKAKLFAGNPRYIVLNRDDEWFDFYNQFEASEHKISYGTDVHAESKITAVKLHKMGSEASVSVDHQTKLQLATHLPGKFNVYNMVAAASAAYIIGTKLQAIEDGVLNLEAVPGRFERVDVGKPYQVIVDYAHTPDALEQLLEAVRQQTKNRLILVFGACGDRDKTKRPIMGEIAANCADRIIVTDEESYNEEPAGIRQMILAGIEAAGGTAKTDEIADRRLAIEKALSLARRGDSVLITGMGHEQFRIIEGEKIPWNDSAVVREIVA